MISRRGALKELGGRARRRAPRPLAAFADDGVETHGLSSFGDLALPPDFPHFAYVNPNAPTGGLLSLQITGTSGNQSFDTFDTLNIYSWKGNGAAGMGATFDTLMTANGDEPDSVYGLLRNRCASRATNSITASGCVPRRSSSTARGSRRPTSPSRSTSSRTRAIRSMPAPQEVDSAAAEGDDVVHVRFVKDRSRDAHLIVVGMPVFSAAWWKGRDFTAATLDAPLGSGAYKVKTFEQGRFIEYERGPTIGARNCR